MNSAVSCRMVFPSASNSAVTIWTISSTVRWPSQSCQIRVATLFRGKSSPAFTSTTRVSVSIALHGTCFRTGYALFNSIEVHPEVGTRREKEVVAGNLLGKFRQVPQEAAHDCGICFR